MTGQKQHVDYHRKVGLRKRLMGDIAGLTAYVPFIGDGDLACDLYGDMKVFGADTDAERVATATKRLPCATIVQADCTTFPFPNDGPFQFADFDAYSEPYPAFRSFWETAQKTDRLILFFTDGHKHGIKRSGWVHYPDGNKEHIEVLNERRKLFNFYFPAVVLPWFVDYIKPYTINRKAFYLRGMMLYWGVVVERA